MPEPLSDALERARDERTPRMALRPRQDSDEELDDIVVKEVEMFRAEAMSNTVWWMCCYFRNGERVTFHVGIDAKPKRVHVSATEMPAEWVDLDADERQGP